MLCRLCEHIPGRAAGFTNSTINLICVGKRRIWYGALCSVWIKKKKKSVTICTEVNFHDDDYPPRKIFLKFFLYLELTGRECRNAFKNTLGIYAYYSCLFSWSTKWSHKTKKNRRIITGEPAVWFCDFSSTGETQGISIILNVAARNKQHRRTTPPPTFTCFVLTFWIYAAD